MLLVLTRSLVLTFAAPHESWISYSNCQIVPAPSKTSSYDVDDVAERLIDRLKDSALDPAIVPDTEDQPPTEAQAPRRHPSTSNPAVTVAVTDLDHSWVVCQVVSELRVVPSVTEYSY